MFRKYNKYILIIFIIYVVITQFPINIEGNQNINEFEPLYQTIDEKLKLYDKKVIKNNQEYGSNNGLIKESLMAELNVIGEYINTLSEKYKSMNNNTIAKHRQFNARIEQNNDLKTINNKLRNRIDKIERKSDSSNGLIEGYKNKYFSTLIELLFTIICVILLVLMLYKEAKAE